MWGKQHTSNIRILITFLKNFPGYLSSAYYFVRFWFVSLCFVVILSVCFCYILHYFITTFLLLFCFEGEKGCEFEWEGRWRGSWRSCRRKNCNQNILYKNLFSLKHEKNRNLVLNFIFVQKCAHTFTWVLVEARGCQIPWI